MSTCLNQLELKTSKYHTYTKTAAKTNEDRPAYPVKTVHLSESIGDQDIKVIQRQGDNCCTRPCTEPPPPSPPRRGRTILCPISSV